MQHFPTGARRDDDAEKLDWTLLPTEALRRVVRHLMAGAKHYGRHNFQKGIPVSRCTQSMMRHAVAFMEGKDDEDHLAAVAVNALFILHMQEVHSDNPEINDDPRGLSVRDSQIADPAACSASGKPPFKCERCGGQWYTFLQCPVCPQQGANDERP